MAYRHPPPRQLSFTIAIVQTDLRTSRNRFRRPNETLNPLFRSNKEPGAQRPAISAGPGPVFGVGGGGGAADDVSPSHSTRLRRLTLMATAVRAVCRRLVGAAGRHRQPMRTITTVGGGGGDDDDTARLPVLSMVESVSLKTNAYHLAPAQPLIVLHGLLGSRSNLRSVAMHPKVGGTGRTATSGERCIVAVCDRFAIVVPSLSWTASFVCVVCERARPRRRGTGLAIFSSPNARFRGQCRRVAAVAGVGFFVLVLAPACLWSPRYYSERF